MTNIVKIKCPVCGTQTLFHKQNEYRPFCSETCHNKDLAAWASDHYHIPGPEIEILANDEDEQSSF